MEIEEVAPSTPEKILQARRSRRRGPRRRGRARAGAGASASGALRRDGAAFLQALAKAFVELDCSLARSTRW
jgi:succinyl-CoA synthetase beta subunit